MPPRGEDLRLRKALDRVASEVKRIAPDLAAAREKLWTPEKDKPATETKIWTPGSGGGRAGETGTASGAGIASDA